MAFFLSPDCYFKNMFLLKIYMALALVFERLKNLVTEQRLRGHKPKLVNALRSRCSVT